MKRNKMKEPLHKEFKKYRVIREKIAPFLPKEEKLNTESRFSDWSSHACYGNVLKKSQ